MKYIYTCVVIDDDGGHLAHLTETVNKIPGMQVVFAGTSLIEGLAFLHAAPKKVDIIFCDIMLLEANGLDFGPQMAGLCRILTYVTAHVHLKGEVLDAMGDDCLIKPVHAATIQSRVLYKLVKRYSHEMPLAIQYNKLLMYDGTTKMVYEARVSQVMLLIHRDNYLDIYCMSDKKERVKREVRATVEQAMALLDAVGIFIRINRAAIINANFMTEHSSKEVVIAGEPHKVTPAYRDQYKVFVNTNTLGKRIR